MQITKELLDKDIAGLEEALRFATQRLEQGKIELARGEGSLLTLKALRDHVMQAEPEVKQPEISPENAAIQARDEAANAIALEDFAKMVAGPGATAEIVEEEDASI